MKIEAYIIAWNESETIRFTIKHYKEFCDKVIIFDNYSTDNTREIAEEMGAEVRLFGEKGQLSDKWYLKVKNHFWKGSDADWVIICDADEILYHPYLLFNLKSAAGRGETIFNTYGWNVFSHTVPRESFLELTTGFHDKNYSKTVIFNPKEIKEINYGYGCHQSQPRGNVKWSTVTPALFHYRNIGGVEALVERHKMYRKRLSPLNKELSLGVHYNYPDERRRIEWEEQYQKSVPFSSVGFKF